jgi:hypothetical protein
LRASLDYQISENEGTFSNDAITALVRGKTRLYLLTKLTGLSIGLLI